MVHCTFRSRCAMLSEWRWAMAIVTCRTMAAASEKASGKHLNKLYTISTFNLQQFVVLRTLMLWLILSCSMKSPINLHFVTPTSLGKRRITPLLNSLKQLSTSHATRKQYSVWKCKSGGWVAPILSHRMHMWRLIKQRAIKLWIFLSLEEHCILKLQQCLLGMTLIHMCIIRPPK